MRHTAGNDGTDGAAPRRPTKPYTAPQLVRYGDVTHLTRTVGPPGKLKDNPNVAKTRTV